MTKELFKYRCFNEYSLESISENVVWVSKPETLNDPFENSYYVNPDMHFDEVFKRTKDVTKKNYIEKQLSFIDSLKNDFKIGGIFSLSRKRNISLMWSHYAECHKGFCIGYRVTPENDLGNGNCKEVKYGKFPEFSLTEMWHAIETSNEKIAKKLFEVMVLSKDINWKYECEERVLYRQSNMPVIPNFEISSITFGMFMSDSLKSIIKKILRNKNVEFFEAHKPKIGYNLEIKPHI